MSEVVTVARSNPGLQTLAIMTLASTPRTRLLKPLHISFLVLVLLLVVQECLNVLIQVQRKPAVSSVDSTLVEYQGKLLLNSVLNEETSLQGYLLNKDKAFVESYKRGQAAFYGSFNNLYKLVNNNLAQRKQLDEIKYLHDRWQSHFAQKALSGFVSESTLTDKTLFESLSTHIRILLQREKKLLNERNQWLHQLLWMENALDILITMVLLAGAGLNLWLLHRRVELPLRQLTEVGQAWRACQLEARLDYSSSDEIGQLADILNTMANELCHRQERSELRNQHLEDLICALSHDLRTPLLATRATLNSMLKGAFGPVSGTWKDVFEEYHQANEELINLVEALLQISRYEAGANNYLIYKPLNWEKIFVQAIAQITTISQCECAITYKISQSLPIVYGDHLEIQRVVQNLLDNAKRVSEADKQIILEVAPLDSMFVQVFVRDEGPGIAPQEKESLFQRFMQGRSQRGGTGLGLYLCRQIVEAHGGVIDVESTLGEGSTFWFTIPTTTDKISLQSKKEEDRCPAVSI